MRNKCIISLFTLMVLCHASFSQRTYSVLSQDGTTKWPLAARGFTFHNRFFTTRLYLLSLDANNSAPIDSIYFGNNGCSFTFETLNGIHVIKMRFRTTGTGFYGKHLLISAIVNGRFRQIYSTYLEMLEASDPDSLVRTLTTVEFKDTKKRGVLDIVEQTRQDLLDSSADIDVFAAGALQKAKAVRRLSNTTKDYLWDSHSLSFQLEQHK